jgi:putative transposase
MGVEELCCKHGISDGTFYNDGRLMTVRRFKCLTMTDPYSKEVPVIEGEVSIGGARVCRILDRLFRTRPLPESLNLDNGPEFAGMALDAWAAQRGVHLHLTQPGNPVQNVFIERSNGKFWDECLNENWCGYPAGSAARD